MNLDDALIRLATAEMLADLGHKVIEVARAGEALAAILAAVRDGTQIDVLVVDLTLPDMDGAEMVARASELRSGLRVIFASGRGIGPMSLDSSKVRYVSLPKPYDITQLAAALEKLS